MSSSIYAARPWNQLYMSTVAPWIAPQSFRGLRKRLRVLEQRETMSMVENSRLQWQAVGRLLQHAYDTTPFYRERFDAAGITPAQITSPEDLKRIPTLTRSDIRTRLDDLWSRRYRRENLLVAATGGTTDTPVQLLRSPEMLPEKSAMQSRFDTWAGMWPGDKVFYLWGARVDYVEKPSWRWKLYDRHLMRRVWAPTSVFNQEVLESYRQTLNEFRPRIIYAYPTPLALLSKYLLECGKPYHRPLSAICTAEPLAPEDRETISQALGCGIFERYGARDFGMIAAECEQHRGMHVNPAAVFVEYKPVEGGEVEGLHEILVTDLLNYGMPLIRYKVNDCTIPTAAACPCGRGYPLIGRVIGRTTDNFYLPNGDVVPGVSLTGRIIKVCHGIEKMQVIQDTMDSFRIRYVPGAAFSPRDLENLAEVLRFYFGSAVTWKFVQTAEIERERSGKTRFCISHVTEKDRAKVAELHPRA
jgi:phenylacetate-CoA ligase